MILGPIKSPRERADGVGMDEAAVAFWLLMFALAGWTVLGALSAVAKRLDDQVCLHNLRVEALALHRAVRRRALGLDGWDVDIIDEPETVEIIDEDTKNVDPIRKVA